MNLFKKKSTFWEKRFDELSLYNTEKARGILHTQEKRVRMQNLQDIYNDKLKRVGV